MQATRRGGSRRGGEGEHERSHGDDPGQRTLRCAGADMWMMPNGPRHSSNKRLAPAADRFETCPSRRDSVSGRQSTVHHLQTNFVAGDGSIFQVRCWHGELLGALGLIIAFLLFLLRASLDAAWALGPVNPTASPALRPASLGNSAPAQGMRAAHHTHTPGRNNPGEKG
ncbi:hypothetical protein B0T20DRAFT_390825 [Sordaria brevicollis]|uniref:Uncharacterized protein n=1 Tax=Sordaria brevicollis TaxID=83679 RepID=A0AAE0PJD4_SORBR|nr:hypothetical protein B0T20DRAFT_390825 [Sordaria brevicollis]